MVLSSHNQNEDTKMFSVRVYPFCKEQDLFSFDPKARQLQKNKIKNQEPSTQRRGISLHNAKQVSYSTVI